MPKLQATARTRDGHTFRSAVIDNTIEEIEALKEHLDNNWGEIGMVRISAEEGFTCIPLDNLSTLSFRVVDEN